MKMKNLLVLITLLSFLSCQKNTSYPDQKEKYFNPNDLSKLSLEDIVNFWENDSLISFSNYFQYFTEYIGGIGLRDDKKSKSIGVAVFASQEKAIESMEGRINLVASVIKPGIPNEILKGKWWYADGLNSCVFVNQWNIIIEVSYIQSEYEEVKTLLIETAAEIASRADLLSQ
jgi:hypothetical protein